MMKLYGKVINGVPCVEGENATYRMPLKKYADAMEIFKQLSKADLENLPKIF